jgi:endonuclease/exonuclease/phosphatase (EEP) superfamily protein YafD
MSPFPDANTRSGWDISTTGTPNLDGTLQGRLATRSNEAIIRLFLCASRIKDCFEFSRPWLALPDGSLHWNTMQPDDTPVVVTCTTTNVR